MPPDDHQLIVFGIFNHEGTRVSIPTVVRNQVTINAVDLGKSQYLRGKPNPKRGPDSLGKGTAVDGGGHLEAGLDPDLKDHQLGTGFIQPEK